MSIPTREDDSPHTPVNLHDAETEKLPATVIPLTSHVTSHVATPPVNHPSSSSEATTRLPKLNLPTFSGDPLLWQSFWDCFEAAVHNNSSLTDVQKLNYLRAQL